MNQSLVYLPVLVVGLNLNIVSKVNEVASNWDVNNSNGTSKNQSIVPTRKKYCTHKTDSGDS